MMFQTIMFGLTMEGTSIQNIVLILLIVGVAVYGYLEIKSLKASVSNLEKTVNGSKVPYTPPIKNQVVGPKLPPQAMGSLPMQAMFQKAPNYVQEVPTDIQEAPNQVRVKTEPHEQATDSEQATELTNLMLSDEEYDSYDLQYSHDTEESENVESDLQNKESEEIKPENQVSILDETIEPAKPDADDIKIIQAPSDPEYSSKTVSELKAILTEMNQPVSGNKTKLIKRIKEHTIVNKV